MTDKLAIERGQVGDGDAAVSGVADVEYTVVDPGDTDELLGELVELILSGIKRATASLVRGYATVDVAL